MELVKILFACSLLASLTSATYYYRRPISVSNLKTNSESSTVLDRHDSGKESGGQSSPSESGEGKRGNNGQHNNLYQGSPAYSVYGPLFLVPARDEQHTPATGGALGAFGSLVIPGFHVGLGGGNGLGGSLSASGGFSGSYGPNHGGHHVVGGSGAHGGAFAGSYATPIHYGYPIHHVGGGGAGGFAAAGFYPGYGIQGIHHVKGDAPAGVTVTENLISNGQILGSIQSQNGINYEERQPQVLLGISPYHQENGGDEQPTPPGFHRPGFIPSSAGRLGYPVVEVSPDQLQDNSLRQNQNPFLQFFQRPIQFLGMFITPQNQANSTSKQPEKPVAEGLVADKPGPEKPVQTEAASEKPPVSQSHSATVSGDKDKGTKQNVSTSANPQKKPSVSVSNAGSTTDKKDKKEKPKATAEDVVASINEVIKASSAISAGSAPGLPVIEEAEGSLSSRAGDDVSAVSDTDTPDVTDSVVNALPSDESPVDIESKPIA